MRRTFRWFSMVTVSLAFLVMSLGLAQAQTSQPSSAPTQSTNDQNTNRGMVEVAINGKAVSINYGRPTLQGRDMLSKAPDGFIWRFGMSESSTFKADTDLMFGDKTLPKGAYSAWIKHVSGKKWTLIFNSETGVWGMPGAKRANDVLEVPLTYSTDSKSVERLTVNLSTNNSNGYMQVLWGSHRLETIFKTK